MQALNGKRIKFPSSYKTLDIDLALHFKKDTDDLFHSNSKVLFDGSNFNLLRILFFNSSECTMNICLQSYRSR